MKDSERNKKIKNVAHAQVEMEKTFKGAYDEMLKRTTSLRNGEINEFSKNQLVALKKTIETNARKYQSESLDYAGITSGATDKNYMLFTDEVQKALKIIDRRQSELLHDDDSKLERELGFE